MTVCPVRTACCPLLAGSRMRLWKTHARMHTRMNVNITRGKKKITEKKRKLLNNWQKVVLNTVVICEKRRGLFRSFKRIAHLFF